MFCTTGLVKYVAQMYEEEICFGELLVQQIVLIKQTENFNICLVLKG